MLASPRARAAPTGTPWGGLVQAILKRGFVFLRRFHLTHIQPGDTLTTRVEDFTRCSPRTDQLVDRTDCAHGDTTSVRIHFSFRCFNGIPDAIGSPIEGWGCREMLSIHNFHVKAVNLPAKPEHSVAQIDRENIFQLSVSTRLQKPSETTDHRNGRGSFKPPHSAPWCILPWWRPPGMGRHWHWS